MKEKTVTKAQSKLINEAWTIEQELAEETGTIGYMARIMVQATLPHRDPKASFFERKNGVLKVRITDLAGIGLPYGSIPRLVLAWLTSEAVIKSERTIVLGDSLSQFMSELGLVPTGGRWGSITRLKEQIRRLFSSAIYCEIDAVNSVKFSVPRIVEGGELWWDTSSPNQSGLFKSHIVLSQEFFDEVRNSPVPVDLRALMALKRSPLALDIYMWLTYRMSFLSKKTSISWEQLQSQFGSGYDFSERGRKNFQQAFTKHLKTVLTVYPKANVAQERGRIVLIPSPTHITKLSTKPC